MSQFKNEILNSHNKYRQLHGARGLTWSNRLQNNAQRWADKLAKKGYLQHENQHEEGENIACMKGSELTGAKATDMWYDEIKDYNFNNPTFNSKTGHFTQVVWGGSTELGVGKATASNGMQFVVARYNPPGNVIGKFKENVLRTNSKPQPSRNNNSNNNNYSSNNNNNNGIVHITRTREEKPKEGRQTDKEFRTTVLRMHNRLRKRHGTAPLKWNRALEQLAADAAQEAARTNTLRSVNSKDTGQNMAAMTGGELTGEKVSTMWYEEERQYDYRNGKFSSETATQVKLIKISGANSTDKVGYLLQGSFTQLVWKGSTDIGVARAFGTQGQTFVVSLYQPPGNIRGMYQENVLPPTGPLPDEKDKQGCSCVIL